MVPCSQTKHNTEAVQKIRGETELHEICAVFGSCPYSAATSVTRDE